MPSFSSSRNNASLFPFAAAAGAGAVLVVRLWCSYFLSDKKIIGYDKESKQTSRAAPHVSSWIPYIGSALEMGADIAAFIRKYSKQFGDSPLFTATILGDKCVFIADPELLNIVFQASLQKSLDDISLQRQFIVNALGSSKALVDDDLMARQVAKIAVPQYHHFLFKGEELEKSMAKMQHIFQTVVLPNLTNNVNGNLDLSDGNQWKQLPLYQAVVQSIFKATVGTLFGMSLATDEIVDQFREFDKGIIGLFNGLPGFILKSTIQARSALKQALSSDEFWDKKSISKFMMERKEKIPFSDEALLTGNLGLLWASTGNSAPAAFWALLRLLDNPEAWNACRQQVLDVVSKRNKDSTTLSLEDLDEMTLLESAFWETLRIYMGNITSRVVKEDIVIPVGKDDVFHIAKGSKIMSFWRILHTDPTIFESPDTFQYDRFIDETKVFKYASGKPVPKPGVIIFGGGQHLCPGRKLIACEFKVFMALIMMQLEIRFATSQPSEAGTEDGANATNHIPGINRAMEGIGVSQPDRDVWVEIRKRKEDQ